MIGNIGVRAVYGCHSSNDGAMAMSRNFGIPNVTTRETVGENQSRGPHPSAYTTRTETNSVGVLPNSRSQEGEPFIHDFEFGSYFLFVSVLVAPALFVCAAVLFYAAFIA